MCDVVNAIDRQNRQRGFTLTELLVTMGIVAILAGFAVPIYTHYFARAKLKNSAALLTHASAQMEKAFLDHRSYAQCDTGQSGDACACGVSLAGDTNFDLHCTIEGGGYVLTASSRARFGLGEEGSYIYTLNNAGARSTLKFAGVPVTGMECWKLAEDSAC